MKNIASKIEEEMDTYIRTLKDLQQSLANTSVVAARVTIHRLVEDMVGQVEVLKNIGMRFIKGR